MTIEGLREILNSEKLILVDASIRSEKDLCWGMYDTSRYGYLDTKSILEATSSMEELEEILSCKNTYTINDVTAELREFERILGDKIQGISFRRTSKNSKMKEKRRRRDIKAKELLCNLQKKVYGIRRRAESSEINRFTEFKGINNPTYNLLFDMTKLISEQIGLKRDFGFLNGRHETDRSKDSDTEERLVATIYQLSLFDRSSCLLSQDTDFINLLGVVTGLICSDSFLPYNKGFREKIKITPFKFYFRNMRENRYELSVQSSKIEYHKEFRMMEMALERSEEIKQEITQMWQKFAQVNTHNTTPIPLHL